MSGLISALLLAVSAQAGDGTPRIIHFGYPDTAFKNVYAGIEFAELIQNSFRDLGSRNFTILAGQRLW